MGLGGGGAAYVLCRPGRKRVGKRIVKRKGKKNNLYFMKRTKPLLPI